MFSKRAASLFAPKRLRGKCWLEAGHNVTPKAKILFDKEIVRVPHQSICRSSNTRYTVTEHARHDSDSSSGHVTSRVGASFTVDVDRRDCYRCRSREQLRIPCRHLLAAIHHDSMQRNGSKPNTESFFDSAYLVRAYHDTFSKAQVSMPLDCELVVEKTIQSPPQYRQAGGRRRVIRERADRAKRQRRIPSAGKRNGQGTSCLPGSTANSTQAHTIESQGREVAEFFAGDVSGSVPATRKRYRCSLCGLTGHNATRCSNHGAAVEEADQDITPGRYVVGASPFTACGVSHLYDL